MDYGTYKVGSKNIKFKITNLDGYLRISTGVSCMVNIIIIHKQIFFHIIYEDFGKLSVFSVGYTFSHSKVWKTILSAI